MSEESVKQNIVRDLDRLPPEALREVRDFIESLRERSSASVFEEIDASIQSVPEEEWQEVPEDASTRLDEYLYRSS